MIEVLDKMFWMMLLTSAVNMAVPLTLAGLGEIFSERAGILNIGLEANMLMGAFMSFAFCHLTGSLWLGVIAGMLGGAAICMLHALFCIRISQNQTIVGITLNLFALGITSFFLKILVANEVEFPKVATFERISIPILSQIPILGNALFNQNILLYITYILLALSMIVLYRTQWGESLMAVGEHPRAADAVGIPVYRIQYLSALVNGLLGGLAGAYLTLAQLGIFTENVTSGRGYIALAVVITGRRHPLKMSLAAILFGAAEALQFRMQALGVNVPSQLLNMLPYVVTMIALLFSVGKQMDPAHLGRPYKRDLR